MNINDIINTVIHDDCMNIMRKLPDKCIDLVLTDPPYGIGVKNKIGGSKLAIVKDYEVSGWDDTIPDKIYFDEMRRISKNQIIWGGNYFIEYLKNTSCMIVWDKDNGRCDFADSEIAWTSFKSAVRNYKYRWQGMLQEYSGKYKEKRYHPTQKPYKLINLILEDYSKKDILVFDPFAGSGTTAVACIKTGRRYILCEKEKKYVDIIHKRIAQAKDSISLLETIND